MKNLKIKLFMLSLLILGVVVVSFAFVNREKPEVKTEEVKAETGQTSYRWFRITGNRTEGATVPANEAQYIGDGANPPAGSTAECEEGDLYQCISGFLPEQTSGSPGNYSLIGSQVPQSTAPNWLRD